MAQSNLTAFARECSERAGRPFPDYASLHRYSVANLESFWTGVWDFCDIIGDPGDLAATDLNRMPGARFFPEGRLSFAENLLRRRDDAPAIIAATEQGAGRTISFAELRREVSQAALALRASGVRSGDRVAGLVSNVPEAVIAALGTAAIGAVWSSCSPDFGVQGVVDRFGQIAPTVFLAVDGYHYGGKRYDCQTKVADVLRQLPSVRQTVIIPDADAGAGPPSARMDGTTLWAEWLSAQTPTDESFERFPFNHPLYILYSSGTTGVPKCIVHGAGGTLLEHVKEHQLHCDVKADDRVFCFTTTGWMMWNWLVTVLGSGATIVLYDGSPFYPDERRLFDLADHARITLFGTSAKFIDALSKTGLSPRTTHSLASVRTITSTGSPLTPERFEFVYREIKTDVHLASISGGTDIVGCFVGGNPNAAVWSGEIQAPGLAMNVDVVDAEGQSLRGTAGELVCRYPFPSMPLGFWNDAHNSMYHAAYFEKFRGVWCHGDWARLTDHGGVVIYGRSDATLNPGGVRIGTAEIYRQVEQIPEVLESLAVGQQWQGDERIVLFVRLREGAVLDDELRRRIIDQVRTNASPRHAPAKVIQVTDIPRTKSGKIVELAVRSVIHDREIPNRGALANPEALEFFRRLPELQT